MIVSLFVILLVIAVILFILGMKDDAIAYEGISLILFLVLTGQSFYITVPFLNSADIVIEKTYTEYGLSAFCLIFVFIDVIFLILHWFSIRKMKRGDVPYVPPGHQ
jgi:hypothetical protein